MSLEYITKLEIDYISELDYIDIVNLSRTAKQFVSLSTDNTILRKILYNRNEDIIIPSNFDIGLALRSLHRLIGAVYDKDYSDRMKRIIYTNILQCLGDDIDQRMLEEYYYDNLIYYTIGFELRDLNDSWNIGYYQIDIPKIFMEYIKDSILNLLKSHDESLMFFAKETELLKDLLFIRDHTFVYRVY